MRVELCFTSTAAAWERGRRAGCIRENMQMPLRQLQSLHTPSPPCEPAGAVVGRVD